MKAKLESGIQLKDYVVSYGDKRQNTFEAASACKPAVPIEVYRFSFSPPRSTEENG